MTLSAADLGASELLQRVRHRLVETETQLRNLRNLGWRPDQLRAMNEEIGRLHSAAGGVPVIAHMMKREQGAAPRYPCLYPWERILLNPKGALAFCPQDWTHGSAIADYRELTRREASPAWPMPELRPSPRD